MVHNEIMLKIMINNVKKNLRTDFSSQVHHDKRQLVVKYNNYVCAWRSVWKPISAKTRYILS